MNKKNEVVQNQEKQTLTLNKNVILELDSKQLSLDEMQDIAGGARIVETDQIPNCKNHF